MGMQFLGSLKVAKLFIYEHSFHFEDSLMKNIKNRKLDCQLSNIIYTSVSKKPKLNCYLNSDASFA